MLIPKDFAFHGIDEVSVSKVGNKLVLESIRRTWSSFADEAAAADFLDVRPDLLDADRVKL